MRSARRHRAKSRKKRLEESKSVRGQSHDSPDSAEPKVLLQRAVLDDGVGVNRSTGTKEWNAPKQSPEAKNAPKS